jgi:hypothetical protein
MNTFTLTAAEVATLLMLSVAVQDVVNGTITPETIEEFKALQPELDNILYKEESPLNCTA